MLNREKQTNRP